MDEASENQLVALWQATVMQYRQTLRFFDETGARVSVNSIDITDSERAETKSRIEHLEKLIAAIKVSRQRAATLAREKASISNAAQSRSNNRSAELAKHPDNITNYTISLRRH